MQLTVLGGAGIRIPLLARGVARMAPAVGLTRLTLFDPDEERLQLMSPLVRRMLDEQQSSLELTVTSDAEEGLRGARFVFSAIRVGGDEGRALDERLALEEGVLGQETVGAGGFAMALRTIPVILEYAHLMERVAPDAWLLSFTNPAGIITQALADHTSVRVLGICDSASGLKARIAGYLERSAEDVHVRYFGLNHLGFVSEVHVDGRDVMPDLLAHYEALRRFDAEFALFDTELVQAERLIPNEYLYFYYYAREALDRLLQAGEARGAQVLRLNTALRKRLKELMPAGRVDEAWTLYRDTMSERGATYLKTESGSAAHSGAVSEASDGAPAPLGGYEGLALATIDALAQGRTTSLSLDVPNHGALSDMRSDDVVEVPCLVGRDYYAPLAQGPTPLEARGLLSQVKAYERLTVEAAVTGDYRTALAALTANPLVPSYPAARRVLDKYLEAHREHLPQFSQ